MKKHILLATLLTAAIAIFGFRGSLLSLPLSVSAASGDELSGKRAGAEPAEPAKPASPVSASSEQTAVQGPPGMDEKVTEWIGGLAADSTYSSWKQARRDIYPLGPGTHSWLVTLTQDGKDVGYMIVTSDQSGNGYVLTEYGSGDRSLYSMKTLYQAMARRELIDPHLTYEAFEQSDLIRKSRLYLGPLKTFWEVTIRSDSLYFDAKTGELMPNLSEYKANTDVSTAAVPVPYQQGMTTVKSRVSVEPFDPFEKPSWVTKDNSSISQQADLEKAVGASSDITYTARLFGGKLTYPLAVTGFDRWNTGAFYVALDHDGSRLLPFELLAQSGGYSR